MNPRERILAAINHRPVDRVPTDMWATGEVQELLFSHFNINVGGSQPLKGIGLNGGELTRSPEAILKLWDILGVDGIFSLSPPYIGPDLEQSGDVVFDEWGFGYRMHFYEGGQYQEQKIYPMKDFTSIDELNSYRWPDPDWYDYDAIPGLIEQCGGRAVCCGYYAPFTYHQYLRGLENNLMDPYMDEEFTHLLLTRLCEFFDEYHQRCFDAAPGLIDLTQVTDDWGSQTGLISSPDIFHKFYKESMGKAISNAHRNGLKVLHHNDGDCRPLLDDIVDMGIDVLNPIQWRCGDWDLQNLKSRYGNQVCFHSALDNQITLPLGSAQDVKDESTMLVETLGADGTGFILGPCHNIQINTPLENILALYSSVR